MIEIRHTSHDWGTKVEAVFEGQTVSNLRIHDLRLRLGNVTVRCGGIGAVGTPREHRMKGYSRAVLESAVEFMGEHGYHLSALFGIPNYYDKYGYAPALVESQVSLQTRDAELAEARYQTEVFSPEVAQQVAEIYERMHAQRTGCIVRDTATWQGFQRGIGWTDRVGAFVVTDGGEVVGYASHNLDPWRYAVNEVGYTDASVFSTLLAEIAARAIALRVERVSLHMPPDDPFVVYCRRYGAEVTLEYRRCAGGMARVIDQAALLGMLQPLVRRRLQEAGMSGWSGEIVIQTDLGIDRLIVGQPGGSYRITMPQWMLAQLLLGYRGVDDALSEADTYADSDLLPVLRVLFPEGYPYIWPADRF